MKNQTEIKGQLLLTEYGYSWDGGSIYLMGNDETGKKIEIVLRQIEFLDQIDLKKIPGRLYINKNLVAQRSEREDEIILKLKNARIDAGFINPPKWMKNNSWILKKVGKNVLGTKTFGNDTIAEWVNKIISFVESDEYLEISKKIKTP